MDMEHDMDVGPDVWQHLEERTAAEGEKVKVSIVMWMFLVICIT